MHWRASRLTYEDACRVDVVADAVLGGHTGRLPYKEGHNVGEHAHAVVADLQPAVGAKQRGGAHERSDAVMVRHELASVDELARPSRGAKTVRLTVVPAQLAKQHVDNVCAGARDDVQCDKSRSTCRDASQGMAWWARMDFVHRFAGAARVRRPTLTSYCRGSG